MLPRMPRLIEDAPIEALDFVVILIFNVIFVLVAALVLWAVGAWPMAGRLAKAYAVLWGAVCFAHMLMMMVHAILRVDLYSHADLYVYSNIAVGVLLLPAWSAYAALEAVCWARCCTSLWSAAAVYVVGFLASFVAWKVVCALYRGHLYQLVFLPVALASYLLFALWPAAGATLYDWLFNLF